MQIFRAASSCGSLQRMLVKSSHSYGETEPDMNRSIRSAISSLAHRGQQDVAGQFLSQAAPVEKCSGRISLKPRSTRSVFSEESGKVMHMTVEGGSPRAEKSWISTHVPSIWIAFTLLYPE